MPAHPAALTGLEAARTRLAPYLLPAEWALIEEDVAAILELKCHRKALILAHNYQTPDIFHGVADIVGDSLALARAAQEEEAEVLVVAGVHFMAETAKILNPSRRVLIPDPEAGCSLAESITAADVAALRARNPGVPVIAYVNTSAAVKALSDYCCTSANVARVVAAAARAFGTSRVILLPDRFLAENAARASGVEIIAWQGACEVHERFTPDDIADLRSRFPGIKVLVHPECPAPVVEAADFAGSTAAMGDYLDRHAPRQVALITECGMSDNLAALHPQTEFIRTCNLCPHMKRITLAKIRRALETLTPEVTLDPALIEAARRPLERMMALS
jgi:quinolinate synthase